MGVPGVGARQTAGVRSASTSAAGPSWSIARPSTTRPPAPPSAHPSPWMEPLSPSPIPPAASASTSSRWTTPGPTSRPSPPDTLVDIDHDVGPERRSSRRHRRTLDGNWINGSASSSAAPPGSGSRRAAPSSYSPTTSSGTPSAPSIDGARGALGSVGLDQVHTFTAPPLGQEFSDALLGAVDVGQGDHAGAPRTPPPACSTAGASTRRPPARTHGSATPPPTPCRCASPPAAPRSTPRSRSSTLSPPRTIRSPQSPATTTRGRQHLRRDLPGPGRRLLLHPPRRVREHGGQLPHVYR